MAIKAEVQRVFSALKAQEVGVATPDLKPLVQLQWNGQPQAGLQARNPFSPALTGIAAAVLPRSMDLDVLVEFGEATRTHDLSGTAFKAAVKSKVDAIEDNARTVIRFGVNKGLLDPESRFTRSSPETFEYSLRGDKGAVDLAASIIEKDRDAHFAGVSKARAARDTLLAQFYKLA